MNVVRSFTVNYTSPHGAFASAYPALATMPFILDSRPGFHRLANAYLEERGLGVWPASTSDQGRALFLSPQSMRTYAEWLANFLEWCERRHVDPLTCSFVLDVAERYQGEMLGGIWSRTGEGLSARTVNARVHVAGEYLTWLSFKKHRGPVEIPYTTKTIKRQSTFSPTGFTQKQVKVRRGSVKVPIQFLRMPTDLEVASWLKRIQESHGNLAALMCETVCLTAMRRAEVTSLHDDLICERDDAWQVVNPLAPLHHQQIRVVIKYETKGTCYGMTAQGEKIGPEREILVPLQLALKWQDYWKRERNTAFRNWLGSTRGAARQARARDCVNLFLQPETGRKFSGKNFYDIWTSVEPPIPGWSPHGGRHWWACSKLWRRANELGFLQNQGDSIDLERIDTSIQSIIALEIAPQLGHSDLSTSNRYLRWFWNMVGHPVSIDLEDDNCEDLA